MGEVATGSHLPPAGRLRVAAGFEIWDLFRLPPITCIRMSLRLSGGPRLSAGKLWQFHERVAKHVKHVHLHVLNTPVMRVPYDEDLVCNFS